MQPIDIDNVFSYHRPDGDQPERYEEIRAGARMLAHLIDDLAPDGPEKTLALRNLQQSVMWANASIACHTGPIPTPERYAEQAPDSGSQPV